MNNYSMADAKKRGFERGLLPKTKDYYQQQNVQLIGRGLWRKAICPFHADTRPSLSVNTVEGCFTCFACGAKGGDIVDFHKLRYGMTFKQAVKDLGAWTEVV